MNWSDRWDTSMMNNYGRPPLMLVRGKGSRVWDDSGTSISSPGLL